MSFIYNDILEYNIRKLLEIENINTYFQLPENYEVQISKKKDNIVYVNIKYTRKSKIQNLNDLPYELLEHIYEYLNQYIELQLELSIYLYGFFNVIFQWKVIHVKHHVHSSRKYDIEDIYTHVIEFRNTLLHKKRRFVHRYHTVFNILLSQEIISLIADLDTFDFIFT